MEAIKPLSVSILLRAGLLACRFSSQHFHMRYYHSTQEGSTVLVTAVIQNRNRIFLDPAFAREAIDTLYRVQNLHPFFLYGFVIMPDHCHLLLKVIEGQDLSRVMRVFKGGISHNIGRGSIWQRRFSSIVANNRTGALHYIHQNPVKAGFVERAELYPWSSASGKWDTNPFDY